MKPTLFMAYRKLLGISTLDAAHRFGVARRTWQAYEKGDRRIPARIIELLYGDVVVDATRTMKLVSIARLQAMQNERNKGDTP